MNLSNVGNMKNIFNDTTKTKIERGKGRDAKKVADLLQSFTLEKSPAYKKFLQHFQNSLSQPELIKIAECLAAYFHLYLDRDSKRSAKLLIKWFDDHWDILHNEIDKIHTFDEFNNQISL